MPQLPDWIRAWQACQCPTSYTSAESNGVTENFVHGVRDKAASRRAFAQMVKVMAEVLRRRTRKHFSQASAITVMLDDRKAYRLIRYKCDAPRNMLDGPVPPDWRGAVSGVVGVLRRGGASAKKRASDLDEDHSQAMAKSVLLAFRRIATIPGEGLDDAFLQSVIAKIRIGLADGGSSAQKCLRFLATGGMPNMLLIIRDRSHIIRNSTRDPLLAEEGFGAWWDDIFGARHALVPDIKNSEEWCEKLLLCQREVVARNGVQGGGVSAVARVMSFAKQRFDSCATPQRQFCCMLAAIAMLLAYQASDVRNKGAVRERSARRLQELPHHVCRAGLAASYSEECLRFVRIFDVDDHDPANTAAEKADFVNRMSTLFLDGHIWTEPTGEHVAGVAALRRPPAQTCLGMALRQAKETPTIYYQNGRVVHLYRKPPKEERQALCSSVHAVIDTMVSRLNAELPCGNLDMLFSIFDLLAWDGALRAAREGDDSKVLRIRRHAHAFCQGWQFAEPAAGARELESAASVLISTEEFRSRGVESESTGKLADNRIAWATVLDPSFDRGDYRVLPHMIRIYLAAADTTGCVERGLGTLVSVLEAHSGPLDEDGEHASCLCEVLMNGPAEVSALATRPDLSGLGVSAAEATLMPTRLSVEFAEQWVALYGRRFGVYKKRRAAPENAPRKRFATMAALARRSLNARDALVAAAPGAPPADQHQTLLGAPRSEFARRAGVENPAAGQKALRKYAKFTRTKVARNRVMAAARTVASQRRVNPYTIGSLNPNLRLRLGSGLAKAPVFRSSGVAARSSHVAARSSGVAARSSGVASSGGAARPRVLNMTGADLPALPGGAAAYDISTPDNDISHATLRADLVVWRHSWELDRSVPDIDFLKSAMLVIAAGKCVIGLGNWKGRVPHQSSHVVAYSPAVESVPVILVLAEPLVRKHPCLCRVIKKCASLPRTCWTVSAGAEPHAHAKASRFTLATTLDVRAFLQSVRRRRIGFGAAGGYFS